MNFSSSPSVLLSSLLLSAYLLFNSALARAETNPIFDRTCNFAEALLQRFEGASELKMKLLPKLEKLKATSSCPGWWLPPSQDETSVKFLLSKLISDDNWPFYFSSEEAWSVVQILQTGEANFLQKILLEKRINISSESITGSGLAERISLAFAERFERREEIEHTRARVMYELKRMLSNNYADLSILDLTAKLQVAVENAIAYRYGSQISAQLHAVVRNALVKLILEIDPTNPLHAREEYFCKEEMNFLKTMFSRCKDPVRVKDLIDYQRLVKNSTSGGQ